MLDVTIPVYQDLFIPTLRAIDEAGGSATKDEIDELAAELAELSPEQMAVEFPPDAKQKGSKVVHRLAWARTYLKKMGAVENSKRGVWTLSDLGKQYLVMPREDAIVSLREKDAAIRHDYHTKHQARLKQPDGPSLEEPAFDEDTSDDVEQDDDLWKETLLDRLLRMTADAFERLAQRLLREAGFKNVEVVGKSGDGGIDGVGVYRPSLVSFPIFFQCKRYRSSVTPSAVRDFRGAMAGRGEKGLLITTGVFTAEARKEATRDGAPPVELIDGSDLCDLLKEYGVGVVTEMREYVTIEEEFFDTL